MLSRDDRNAIEGLFDRLGNVEREGAYRDPEAEALIRDKIARQPNSTYYMAQTIVVQEQALEEAERRIAQLQRQLGGHLQQPQQQRGPWGQPPRQDQDPGYDRRPMGGGGGFLAGAAQTALGVAGGVLLGNMIGGLFSSNPAQADEFDPNQDQQDADPGQDDFGNDDDMFGGGFDTGGDF